LAKLVIFGGAKEVLENGKLFFENVKQCAGMCIHNRDFFI